MYNRTSQTWILFIFLEPLKRCNYEIDNDDLYKSMRHHLASLLWRCHRRLLFNSEMHSKEALNKCQSNEDTYRSQHKMHYNISTITYLVGMNAPVRVCVVPGNIIEA